MREERGTIQGDHVISELFTLWGIIVGNVSVVAGGKFYLRGSVYGNMNVAPGGRAHIFGNLQGDLVVEPKAKVIHSGTIGGDAINQGGRLHFDRTAKVGGKTKTRHGETTFEEPPNYGA